MRNRESYPRATSPSIVRRVAALAWWVLACEGMAASEPVTECGVAPAFHDGDRVCFVGDSITAGGVYHQYLELFYNTRFPDRHIHYYNCGIGGDHAAAIVGAAAFRIQRDILSHKPTVATVMLGMNDIGGRLYDPKEKGDDLAAKRQAALDLYRTNMPLLLKTLQEAGVHLILFTPSILDDTAEIPGQAKFAGANDALKRCAESVRQWAKELMTGLVEIHDVMDRINLAEQARNPAFSIQGVGQKEWRDRVHPGPGGHLVMAYTVLKAQQMTGCVNHVVVDAASVRALDVENASLSQLKKGAGNVEFDLLSKSLPVVFPKEARAALELVPFNREFNQELLAVRGLEPGKYQLSIDGQAVGLYSASQLAEGIDLATNSKTPQYQQSAKAAGVCRVRSDLGEEMRQLATFRYNLAKQGKDPLDEALVKGRLLEMLASQVNNPLPKGPAATYVASCLRDLEDEGMTEKLYEKLGDELRQLCRPVVHHYCISPAGKAASQPQVQDPVTK